MKQSRRNRVTTNLSSLTQISQLEIPRPIYVGKKAEDPRCSRICDRVSIRADLARGGVHKATTFWCLAPWVLELGKISWWIGGGVVDEYVL